MTKKKLHFIWITVLLIAMAVVVTVIQLQPTNNTNETAIEELSQGADAIVGDKNE